MPLIATNRLDQLFADGSQFRALEGKEVLLNRARVLPQQDRLVIELAFKNQLSMRQIAQILKRPPGSISRRLNRLRARLCDPLVAALLDPDCTLAPRYHAIAIQYFAQGKRLDQLMREHEVTRFELRGILSFVRGWLKGTRDEGMRG